MVSNELKSQCEVFAFKCLQFPHFKMNLLPKTDSDFAETQYWNKFFKERGSKEFEWYGEYAELCGDLHKYIKKEDDILVVGCGNSMLSADLFDLGYKKITNIDISSVAIKQMKNKVGKSRPEMIFEQMDALKMTYDNENFSVVLDKGTLDALMPSDTDADNKRTEKFFSEVNRVLRVGGRYIVISLLQSHILKVLLAYFTELGWMIRISRCWDVERKKISETGSLTMPVFMIVGIKLKKLPTAQLILEVNILANGRSERVATKENVLAMVEGLQRTILHSRYANGEIEIKFCKMNKNEIRYSIYVVDASKDQRKLLKYAAFIVPHGRETEWMFGTPEGRSYLRESSGFDRLAVITFHRSQDYGSMDDIQNELRQTILQLAPCYMPISENSPKVPYLTLGDGVGIRKTIYSGTSEYSGDLIVEEVEIENNIFRRLIFMSNQAVVQSEVKMKQETSKNRKGKANKIVDSSYVASNHIAYLSIGASVKATESHSLNIGVLGLGGGGLCMFLRKIWPNATVTAVEIDPLVVRLAEEYFGFITDDKMKVVVKDGLEFLKEKPKLDVIIYDVDSKQQGSPITSPPSHFIDYTVLKTVSDILGDTGIFVTNVVTRVKEEHNKLVKKLREHFALLSWYDLNEDVNGVIFASNFKNVTKDEWNKRIKDASIALENSAQEKLKTRNELLDLSHLMNTLVVY